jgi:hypothetical protein
VVTDVFVLALVVIGCGVRRDDVWGAPRRVGSTAEPL